MSEITNVKYIALPDEFKFIYIIQKNGIVYINTNCAFESDVILRLLQ